jgi:hypothetical protein
VSRCSRVQWEVRFQHEFALPAVRLERPKFTCHPTIAVRQTINLGWMSGAGGGSAAQMEVPDRQGCRETGHSHRVQTDRPFHAHKRHSPTPWSGCQCALQVKHLKLPESTLTDR